MLLSEFLGMVEAEGSGLGHDRLALEIGPVLVLVTFAFLHRQRELRFEIGIGEVEGLLAFIRDPSGGDDAIRLAGRDCLQGSREPKGLPFDLEALVLGDGIHQLDVHAGDLVLLVAHDVRWERRVGGDLEGLAFHIVGISLGMGDVRRRSEQKCQ